MHPNVCRFISESIYEGRLGSIPECANQKNRTASAGWRRRTDRPCESGIVFSGVEHDGDIQRSDEEVERVKAIYNELLNRPFTDKDGKTKPLELSDFLFIAPYNAQVRALKNSAAERRPSRQRRQVPRPGSSRMYSVAVLQLRRVRLARPEIHPRSLSNQRRHLPRQMFGHCRRRSTHRKLAGRLN